MILRTIVLPLAGLLICACEIRAEITEKTSFVVTTATPGSAELGACTKIIWATDSVLIATAKNKRLQAFDANSGKELWTREFETTVDALTCNADHVYVALRDSPPRKKEGLIRRLEMATGADSTPKGIPQPFLAHALVWSPELKALCVLEHKELWIYSADLLRVTGKSPYSGMLPIVTSDGKSVLLAEDIGSCTLIDLKTGSINHIHGPPNKGDGASVPVDVPFLSNAFHSSGGPLIRIIDNYWATGRIYFHSNPKDEAVEVDSKNGHAVAGVHWPTQRLAVSGTERNLLLFSTTGKSFGEIQGATTSRTYSISFSPSGSRIATLGSDGRVKVFEIP